MGNQFVTELYGAFAAEFARRAAAAPPMPAPAAPPPPPPPPPAPVPMEIDYDIDNLTASLSALTNAQRLIVLPRGQAEAMSYGITSHVLATLQTEFGPPPAMAADSKSAAAAAAASAAVDAKRALEGWGYLIGVTDETNSQHTHVINIIR